jgi:hypothetical protein
MILSSFGGGTFPLGGREMGWRGVSFLTGKKSERKFLR